MQMPISLIGVHRLFWIKSYWILAQMRIIVLCCFISGIASVDLKVGPDVENQIVKTLYNWDGINFEELNNENGLMNFPGPVSDFDYDPYSGFLCLAHQRFGTIQPVTVSCFDTQKYKPYTSPVLIPFPTLKDNELPVMNSTSEDFQARNLVNKDESFEKVVYPRTKKTLKALARDLLIGDYDDDAEKSGIIVSQETPSLLLEGNEHINPLYEKLAEEIPEKKREPHQFVSVSKIHFDDCGRLWFLDQGGIMENGEFKIYKNPSLWSFEVKTKTDRTFLSKLYLQYEFTSASSAEGLSDFVVDVYGSDCDVLNVYVANYRENHVLVYDHQIKEDYIINSNAFEPVSSESVHHFNGQEYEVGAGIYSISLGQLSDTGFRDLYFSHGAGQGEYVINTKILRKLTTKHKPRSVGYRGCGIYNLNQVYDSKSKVIFFMSPSTKSIQCWNTEKTLNPNNFGTVYTNEDLMSGWSIKMDLSNNLWFMANNYNLYKNEFFNTTNYRLKIYRSKVVDLIRGTVCESDNLNERARPPVTDEESTFDEFIDPFVDVITAIVESINPLPDEEAPAETDVTENPEQEQEIAESIVPVQESVNPEMVVAENISKEPEPDPVVTMIMESNQQKLEKA